MVASCSLEIVSPPVILHMTRAGDSVGFALMFVSESSTDNGGDNSIFECLISILEAYVPSIRRVVVVECLQESAGLVVKGHAEAGFLRAMAQIGASPLTRSDSVRY